MDIANRIAQRWARRLANRHASRQKRATMHETVANMHELPPSPRRYIIGDDDDIHRQGITDGTMPLTVVDSGCTSGVGTVDDPCRRTGSTSNKEFILPGGEIMAATKIAEYPFQVRDPAKQLHITPGITTNLLLSTSKFAAANYITIFDKEEVNIYDANDTVIAVTRGAILRGFKCPTSGLWCIPLVKMVLMIHLRSGSRTASSWPHDWSRITARPHTLSKVE